MDINATSLLAQNLAYGRLQSGQVMLKNAAQGEQQVVNMLTQAIEGVANPGTNRGTQLDISV